MAKYRKKPIEVEAIELTKENFEEVEAFIGTTAACRHYSHEGDFLSKKNPIGIFINNLEGHFVVASIGDYIIKGTAGEFYPCKPHIFAETYEDA